MAERFIKPELLTTEEASEYLGVAAATLATWRCRGRPDGPAPHFRKLSKRCVRYTKADLDEFLEQCRCISPGNEFTTKKLK